MTQQRHGVCCPLVRLSGWAAMFFLLAAPTAFSQQQKLPSPMLGAKADVNDRIAQLALATSAKQGDYVIGRGDLLSIQVFDVPELSREVRVNETGFISLPLIPVKVSVIGLTTYQLQDKLAELLQTNGLVSTPQVTVSLKEQRSQPITVIGAVRSAMVIQSVGQMTLLQVLTQAGGVADDAGTTVTITRPPSPSPDAGKPDAGTAFGESQTFSISLADLLESGDSRFNIPILGGDIVSVPRAGIIYAIGAVNHPGGFPMQNDRDRMTALKLISLAGGPTGSAKVKQAVILRKNPDTGKRDQVPVDLNKVMHLKTDDVMLQGSDILFVPDSSGKKALNKAGNLAVGVGAALALVGATSSGL